LAGYYFWPIRLEFAIGMACALLIARPGFLRVVNRHWQFAIFAVGVATFLTGSLYEALWQPHALPQVRAFVFGLSSAALVALSLRELAGGFRLPRLLVWLGGASYSIYLVHFSIITLTVAALLQLQVLPSTFPVMLVCAMTGVAADALSPAVAIRRLGT
jgi:exopolysaccharide production protein ExoZ